MNDEQLAEIEARANDATPGPWWTVGDARPFSGVISEERAIFPDTWMTAGFDAEFIAHARTDIPALITALRAAQARVAELEATCFDLRCQIKGLELDNSRLESER